MIRCLAGNSTGKRPLMFTLTRSHEGCGASPESDHMVGPGAGVAAILKLRAVHRSPGRLSALSFTALVLGCFPAWAAPHSPDSKGCCLSWARHRAHGEWPAQPHAWPCASSGIAGSVYQPSYPEAARGDQTNTPSSRWLNPDQQNPGWGEGVGEWLLPPTWGQHPVRACACVCVRVCACVSNQQSFLIQQAVTCQNTRRAEVVRSAHSRTRDVSPAAVFHIYFKKS